MGNQDEEIKIISVAEELFRIANYHALISKKLPPTGSVLRRCPDTTKLSKLGFKPRITINEGLLKTYQWYLNFHKKSK